MIKHTRMNNLNQKEWIALMKDTEGSVLLDVRTEEEFESGYIDRNLCTVLFFNFFN